MIFGSFKIQVVLSAFLMLPLLWMAQLHAKSLPRDLSADPSENHEKDMLELTRIKLKACEKKWNNGHQIEFGYSETCHQQLYTMMLGEAGLDGVDFFPCEVKVWGIKGPKRLFLDCHEEKLPDSINQAFPNQNVGTPMQVILSSCQILSYEFSQKEPLAKEEKNPRIGYYHHIDFQVTPTCYEALVNQRYNLEEYGKITGCRAGISYPLFRSFAKKSNHEEEGTKEGKEELGLWCIRKQRINPLLSKISLPSVIKKP